MIKRTSQGENRKSLRHSLLRPCVALALCIFSSALARAYEPEVGEASAYCNESILKCILQWNMGNTPRTNYHVQRYLPAKRKWHTESTMPGGNPTGRYETPLDQGQLYRVYLCEDAKTEHNCVSSTVVWSPLITNEKDEIPVKVESPDGKVMCSDPSGDLMERLIQYNVYQFIKVYQLADMKGLPQMATPKGQPEEFADWVHENVYPNYKGVRELSSKRAEQRLRPSKKP